MTQISGSVTVDIDAGRLGREIAERVVAAVREEIAARFGGPGAVAAADHYAREQEPTGPIQRGEVRHGGVVDNVGHWEPEPGSAS